MNKTTNLRRLQNEVSYLQSNKSDFENIFKIDMVNDDMFHWVAILYGPKDTLYEGYQFKLDIKIPDNYPFSPPTVKFVTPIEHLNVNKNGDICLDILKNDGWAASQSIKSVMISIGVLLGCPNPQDPFNPDLAQKYRNSESDYAHTIKKYCEKYAKV